MENKKTQTKYVLIFILFLGIITTLLYIKKEHDIKYFLQYNAIQNKQNFTMLYQKYKKISDLIFDVNINKKEILTILYQLELSNNKLKKTTKEKLFQNLSPTYNLLKKHNIQQLHFILPNNESLLYFNHNDIPKTSTIYLKKMINYVNKEKKAINGFEKNDFLEDFVFLYPLFSDANSYLGSVSISFSSAAFKKDFTNTYYKEYTEFFNLSNISSTPYDTNILSKIVTNKFKNPFSIFDSNTHNITTFIPIQTITTKKVFGIFMIQNHSSYIHNKIKNYYISLLFSYFLFVSLFIYIYKTNIKFNDTINTLSKEMKIQEVILFKQSKMAQLGEMIDSIAHQWKTPISLIKLYAQHSILILKDPNKNMNKLLEYQNKSILQIDHLVNTIDEFKGFFKPISKIQNIPIQEIIDSTLLLMKDELIKHMIFVEIKGDTNSIFTLIPNEFKHILINLFNNSRDAFNTNKIKNRTITVKVATDKEYNQLEIYDNAGGIPENIINDIFEPNFTTKTKDMGTGIGLYIVKKIIEKIEGTIEVKNIHDGACFKIKIKNINSKG